MLYEDLTGKILEACFEVSGELGAGFLESVYEKALIIALGTKNISAREQVSLPVTFRGVTVGQFYADILVEEKVLLELKAVNNLTKEHYAQIINYLNAAKVDVGLLINFGNPKLEYKRFYRQNHKKPLREILA